MAENVGAIVYTVDMDTAAVTKGADRVNAALDAAQQAFDRTDKSSTSAGRALNAAGQSLDAAGRAADSASRSVAGVGDSLSDAAGSGRRAASALGSTGNALGNLGNSANDAGRSVQGADRALDGLTDTNPGNLNRIGQSLTSATTGAGRAETQFDRTRTSSTRLARAQEELSDASKDLADASSDANDPLSDIVDTLLEGANSSSALNQQLTLLARAIQAVIAASALRSIAEMVQGYQEMADRVRMATSSTEEFEMVQARLVNTANGTFRALSEAQELYIRSADSLRSMGYTTSQALDVTDSLSYAFVTNATSADKASAATDAFAKILAKGKVEADAWETIVAATPSVINAIADASGRTAAQVRELGAAGKLSAADLSEGLRKSLDGVSKAAGEMGNNLRDASTRMTTALTAVFVEVEKQTGAWAKLTAGIIEAAEWMLNSAGDSDKIASAITGAATAATALASVIAGRLLTAMFTYAKAQSAAVAAAFSGAAAARAAAAANLTLATSEYNVAAAAVAAQRAIIAAGGSMAGAAADAAALAAMESRLLTATTTLTAAQAAMTGTTTALGVALGGLRTVMGFLGGPAGVILLAATALYAFTSGASDAKTKVDALNGSLEKLSFNQLQRATNDVKDQVAELNVEYTKTLNKLNSLTPRPWESKDSESYIKRQAEVRAELDDVNQALATRNDRLKEIAAQQDKLGQKQAVADVDPTLPPDAGVAERLENLRKEEALAKQVGVERAKLKAIQDLGTNATEAERAEAVRLATSIYNLQEAEKKQKSESSKGSKQAESDAKKVRKAIDDLSESVARVGMNARDEAIQKAVDSLNGLGTPEQVARVKELAAAAFDAERAKAATEAYKGLNEQILQAGLRGKELAQRQAEVALGEFATSEQIAKVRELSGALYEAQQRTNLTTSLRSDNKLIGAGMDYADDLARYQQYRDAQLITDESYMQMKAQREQAYEEQRRALQEETFRQASLGNELLFSSIDALGNAGTQALSGLLSGTSSLKDALGGIANTILSSVIGSIVQVGVEWVKQQIIMQTAGQAAAVASTAASVAQAAVVGAAWAGPAALASLATLGSNAAPAAAAITSTTIVAKTAALAGGRQYGGPVAAGNLYRVNEGGAPEIFNAAGGKQYMMPNTRGEVVSNKEAAAPGGNLAAPVVNVNNYGSSQASAETRFSEADRRWVVDVVVGDMQANGRIGQTSNQINGTQRRGR